MGLLDTHLDLLDTDITGDYFCLRGVLKASSGYVFGASSGRLGGRGVVALGVSSGRVLGASWGRADVFWGRILCLHGDAVVIFLFYSFLGVFAAPISFSFCF